MKPTIANRPALNRIFLASAVAASILAFIFLTPPGRVFAQGIWKFFTQVTAPQIALTPAGTPPQATDSNFTATCGGYEKPTCTVAQVRGMVKFDVLALVKPPDGMHFAGATGGPENVMLAYVNATTGAILVYEQPWSESTDELWEVSTSAVVENVTIGPLAGSGGYATGEYAIGAWTGPSFRMWDLSPDLQTLRWRLGETVYTLLSVGKNFYKGRLLDKAGLAELAASMTDDPAVLAATPFVITPYPTRFSVPTMIPNSGWIGTVQEAETLAGFDIVEPTRLPDGYFFDHAVYASTKGNVCLFYKHPYDMNPYGSLVIIQNASGRLPDVPEWTRLSLESSGFFGVDSDWINTPVTPVPVAGAAGGTAGEIRTAQSPAIICGENPQLLSNTLLWKNAEGRAFIIMARGGPFNPFLSSIEARRLAENLNGSSTIPVESPDPERLASAKAAEKMLGSDILTPTFIPKEFSFEQAQYKMENSVPAVVLAYSAGHIQFLSITVRLGTNRTLEDVFNQNPKVTRRLTVRNQPAAYLQGTLSVDTGEWCWVCSGAQILTWFEDGKEYEIMVEFPSSTTKETLIQIAESMK